MANVGDRWRPLGDRCEKRAAQLPKTEFNAHGDHGDRWYLLWRPPVLQQVVGGSAIFATARLSIYNIN
jgi:hypothetical protein